MANHSPGAKRSASPVAAAQRRAAHEQLAHPLVVGILDGGLDARQGHPDRSGPAFTASGLDSVSSVSVMP